MPTTIRDLRIGTAAKCWILKTRIGGQLKTVQVPEANGIAERFVRTARTE